VLSLLASSLEPDAVRPRHGLGGSLLVGLVIEITLDGAEAAVASRAAFDHAFPCRLGVQEEPLRVLPIEGDSRARPAGLPCFAAELLPVGSLGRIVLALRSRTPDLAKAQAAGRGFSLAALLALLAICDSDALGVKCLRNGDELGALFFHDELRRKCAQKCDSKVAMQTPLWLTWWYFVTGT
jgi:hypothetical protein